MLVLKRLQWPLAAVVTLVLVATAGYVAVEGYGWLDAFYMSVITLGTIGYGEVHDLHTDGRTHAADGWRLAEGFMVSSLWKSMKSEIVLILERPLHTTGPAT